MRKYIIPGLLLIYLGVMIYLGWPSYQSGAVSGLLYFGGTAVVLACIAMLHFNLKRAEERRKERNDK